MNNEKQKVVFLLKDQRTEIDFSQQQPWAPDTTVLNYLRSLPDRKGTKEGCAEGDCGACTVVLAGPGEGGKMEYKACDSCIILLPMLHGKQLITVEDLGRPEAMHPVQQAMVDCDGSQCGYCTPGFVMSLFALHKKPTENTRADILDGLTGNLCRCTGYRSILAAADQACQHKGPDQFSLSEQDTLKALAEIKDQTPDLALHTPSHTYLRPTQLAEAYTLRKQNPNAMLVCGATDIGLKVTKQKQELPLLLDLSGLDALKAIEKSEHGMRFGATASLEAVKAAAKDAFPALYDMLAVFGSRQIREQGTLGGNVANASPIGDTPPVLMALGASIELGSLAVQRILPIQDFITGYRTTDLRPDEIITHIHVPFTPQGTIVRAYKVSKRKDLDISTVSGGFRLRLSEDGRVEEIALYYGGMAAMTKRAAKAEAYLLGHPWEQGRVEAAMDLVEAEFTPISDARSGKEGRRLMARNLLLKFWSDTALPTPARP